MVSSRVSSAYAAAGRAGSSSHRPWDSALNRSPMIPVESSSQPIPPSSTTFECSRSAASRSSRVTAQVRSVQFLLAVGALVLPLHLGAQGGGSATQETPEGTLTGRVVAEDSLPIAQARVRVAGRTTLVLSGSDGRFTLSAVRAGGQGLGGGVIGYRAFDQLIQGVGGQTIRGYG